MTTWLLAILPVGFMAAVGACVGSFLNVVAYRLPRGEGLFRPGSRCPNCETPLTWRENFPVLGWLWLRGRCRFCRSPVSADYPMVETGCALIFAGLFAAWMLHNATGLTMASRSAPEWTNAGAMATWPMFVLVLALIASLIGMTLIDARTFTIPISMPTLVTALALLTHPVHALGVSMARGGLKPWTAPGAVWTIPTPQPGWWMGATLGGGAGLALVLLLLAMRVIPRSFADFEAWESEALRSRSGDAGGTTEGHALEAPEIGPTLLRVFVFTAPGIALMAVGMAVGIRFNQPMVGMGVGLLTGLVVGTALRAMIPDNRKATPPAQADTGRPVDPGASAPGTEAATAPGQTGVSSSAGWTRAVVSIGLILLFTLGGALLGPGVGAVGAGVGLIVAVVVGGAAPVAASTVGAASGAEAPHWLEYPHSRREMLKELLFVGPVLLLALGGGWLASTGPGVHWWVFAAPPLWLTALAGSILGVLAAGGLVWGIRIVATLAIGREAMGMGDVHLMACVGAALGWKDPLLAFFTAPAFGLTYAVLSMATKGRAAVALPYGPHLALATVMVVVCKPWFESLLTALTGQAINLP